MITKGSTADETTAPVASSPVTQIPHPNSRKGDGDRGDLLIQGLFARGTDTIVDVQITDTDALSYRLKDPHKVLVQHVCKKKHKYLDACLAQRRHFTPFVVSTDGLAGPEAKELLKRLSLRLSDK